MNEKTEINPAEEPEERFERLMRLAKENFGESELFVTVTYVESHQQNL